MPDQTGGAATTSTAAPLLPQRRPRVREVSSRFMSPLPQPNSTPNTSDHRRSKSAHRRQTDENLIPEPNRISDNPSIASPAAQKKHHHQRAKHQTSENGESNNHPNSNIRVSSRPDSPIAIVAERTVSSRYRQVPNSIRRSILLNSISSGCSSAAAAVAATAAARLLQEATSDELEQRISRVSSSSSLDSSSSCPDSTESSGNSTGGDCARSLNFSVFRPPHHPLSSSCARKGMRKVISHQEDVHSLKMLSNHYLQWRFANSKAEACLRAQKHEAEKKFWSLGGKIIDKRDNVEKKRREFGLLRGIKNLTTVVESQMPSLEEWSTLEEDYSSSLAATTNALLSSSLRLPVSTEVRVRFLMPVNLRNGFTTLYTNLVSMRQKRFQVDVRQLGEALNSALKVVELLSSHIQGFIHNSEEMDMSISELAKIVSEEKSRIDECGYTLIKTYSSQVKECSLQGALMQLYQCSHHQPQTSEASA